MWINLLIVGYCMSLTLTEKLFHISAALQQYATFFFFL